MDWEKFSPKRERERADLTQAQMAAVFDVNPSQISRWENEPEAMTMAQLRKWADACGYFRSQDGVDLGDLFAPQRQHLQTVVEYVGAWFDYAAADDVPPPDEVTAALKRVRFKPVGVFAGAPDSAKSRLANTLYGKDVLPVGFGPATRLLCLCRHVRERPEGMDALVYVFGQGFDLSRATDVSYVRERQLMAGGYEILDQVGVHDYQKPRGGVEAIRSRADESAARAKRANRGDEEVRERYALIYIDTPFLLATDILDAPGVSEDPTDVELAFEAIRRADYVIHCSTAAGYMGPPDLQILQEVMERLPEIRDKNANPFANLLLVCSHAASHITDLDLDQIRYVGATRLANHLQLAAGAAVLRRCFGTGVKTIGEQRDALLERITPFFVENAERRHRTVSGIEMMLKVTLPRQQAHGLVTGVNDVMTGFREAYRQRIQRIDRLIFDINAGLSQYKKMKEEDAQRTSEMNEKKNNLSEILYEMREQCEADVRRVADFYMDYRNVEKIIREKYGDRRDDAKAGLGALITAFMQDEVTSLIRRRIPRVAAAVREIAEFHTRRLEPVKSDLKIGSISEFDLDTAMRIGGGGLGGGIGLLALTGAFPVLAPVVAVGMLIAGVISALGGLLRSWQERLARSAAEDLRTAHIAGVLVTEIQRQWDRIAADVEEAVEAMEAQYRERMAFLANLAEAGHEEQERRLNRDLAQARATLEYLEKAPVEG